MNLRGFESYKIGQVRIKLVTQHDPWIGMGQEVLIKGEEFLTGI